MRSGIDGSDLESARRRFKAWRARRPRRGFPAELWQAAWQLVGEYSISRVCRELGLNASRLVEKGRSSCGKGNAAGDAVTFVELPALEMSRGAGIGGAAASVVEQGCRLTVESAGARVTLVLSRGAVVEIACHQVGSSAARAFEPR
jgi:transposase-like protein